MEFFLHQTFTLEDIPKIFVLGFLEWLLSADNAVIIALLIRPLPVQQRKTALFIGIISSFVLRGIGIASISFLIRHFWIQLVGAAYLFFVSIRYFTKKEVKQIGPTPVSKAGFWKIVLLVELLDLAFALDSIIAGLVFVAPYNVAGQINPKLWIIYLGGMLGIVGIRFASELFSKLMDRFPKIEDSAHLLIGWIAVQLTLEGALEGFSINRADYPFIDPIFWSGIVVLFFLGLIKMKSKSKG